MTGRSRVILIFVVFVILWALFYVFFIRAQQTELAETRDQIESEENEQVQLRTTLERLQALQENAPQLQAALAKIRERVPEDHEVPNFIFQVQQAANASGVGFLDITPELPKQPPEGAEVAQVRMLIGARGGYFALQDFMRRLYALDRALRIDVVDMAAVQEEGAGPAAGPGPTRVDLDVNARIFFELPATAGAAGTLGTGTTGATPAPGGSPAVTPSP